MTTRIAWRPVENTTSTTGYTGLFETGSVAGVLRASVATPPTFKDGQCVDIVPAVALKFFRDGLPSVNTIAMYSLNVRRLFIVSKQGIERFFFVQGQPGCNFFDNELSNHVSAPDGALLQALAKKFHTASEHETKMGLSELARYTNARCVPSSLSLSSADSTTHDFLYSEPIISPVAPYRLAYQPNPAIRSCLRTAPMSPWYQQFFETLQSAHTKTASCIQQADYLYKVWAYAEPSTTDAERVHIADLVISGAVKDDAASRQDGFFASQLADRHLFFQHVRMEADYQLRRDWIPRQ